MGRQVMVALKVMALFYRMLNSCQKEEQEGGNAATGHMFPPSQAAITTQFSSWARTIRVASTRFLRDSSVSA